MNKHPLRHFFTNIICATIPNKARRKKVRVLLNSDMRSYIKFIRNDCKCKIRKLRTAVGYGAQNLIIIVNDTYAYKFPLRRANSNELALREKRIVDAFSKISPIHVPHVEILKLDDKIVRKYEYVRGRTFTQMSHDEIITHAEQWSTELANFIYTIANSNPPEIADLKKTRTPLSGNQTQNASNSNTYGWCHGDICGNFMIDPDTMQIVAIIDWEDCYYGDFARIFHTHLKTGSEFISLVYKKYLNLCKTGGQK